MAENELLQKAVIEINGAYAKKGSVGVEEIVDGHIKMEWIL